MPEHDAGTPARVAFGARLRQVRRAHLLTQHELAERLGTDQRVVSRWERGVATPRSSMQRRLRAVLGRSADALLGTEP